MKGTIIVTIPSISTKPTITSHVGNPGSGLE